MGRAATSNKRSVPFITPFCFTNSVKFIIDSLTMIWTLIISFLIWLMVNSSVRYGKTGILVYTSTSISSTETSPSSSLLIYHSGDDCKCCSINIIHSIIICFSHEIFNENSVWRKDVRQLTADDGYLRFLNVLLLSYSSLFIFFYVTICRYQLPETLGPRCHTPINSNFFLFFFIIIEPSP